jgi:sigma-B regulation protein RsbU (phosphoserine phosphatase)
MAIPLVLKDSLVGVMDLESPEKDAFTEDQRNTLVTLAGQLAVAIENARLYERVARDEARLEKDLEMAREIQSALLPQAAPLVRGLQVGIGYQPARVLGGDLYDFLEFEDGALGIAVGDVSGKGTAAALSGAQAIGILRSLGRRRYSPREMLRLMNEALGQKKIEAHFISLCYAVWEPRRRELRISNAGLPYPLLYQRGKTERIQVAGLPLGLMDAIQYEERVMTLYPGDIVAIYSDGVVESTNRRRGEFGHGRLKQVIVENKKLSAAKIAEVILARVAGFARRVVPQDDRTLVVLKQSRD